MEWNTQRNIRQNAILKRSTLHRLGALALLGFSLSACNITAGGGHTAEGIGYRQARFSEMMVMKSWRDCRDEALVLDKSARSSGLPSRYLASAKALQSCEAAAGPEIVNLNLEERMRAIAVVSLNFLKGGDVERARTSYESFQQHFGGRDLRFPDGSSYLETIAVLLDMTDSTAAGELSTANVNATLKSELRRARYWERH
ncbi:MAG: hypothetical protein CMM58_02125 [Rhodospirillaceae bacterium]|nr:hypothetical protein [Rhodospirillaceae bacterium]|tara:strand:+ start:1158 stop:1757 length:600 start_codon:yes stop_codon:yes gene_type:complete